MFRVNYRTTTLYQLENYTFNDAASHDSPGSGKSELWDTEEDRTVHINPLLNEPLSV